MISLLCNIIKAWVLTVLMNDFLKRHYPNTYKNSLIMISYKLIYIYSKGQIMYNNVVLKINTIIESNSQVKKIVNNLYKQKNKQNEIYQIKNDSIHIKYYTDNSEIYFEPDENSIYLFSDNETVNDNQCVNRVISHSQPIKTNYEVSNIQFILVEVKINETYYKINLKTEKFNYYIVDNILDLKFFKYYLYNYKISNLTNEDRIKLNKLNVKIIDNAVTVRDIEISDDKFIIIKKDDYIY